MLFNAVEEKETDGEKEQTQMNNENWTCPFCRCKHRDSAWRIVLCVITIGPAFFFTLVAIAAIGMTVTLHYPMSKEFIAYLAEWDKENSIRDINE